MMKVKSGDLDRMGLLFERHYKQLYGFLFRMSFDKEGSEDMVQNVFLRMLKYRHTYVGNGDFKPWMYHLARNVLNDFFKVNGRMNMVGESEAVQIPDNETSRWLEKQEETHLITKAMNTLSEESREILILSRYQELAYTEIASILNISEANVRVRIHRAMSQLKTNYLKLADA